MIKKIMSIMLCICLVIIAVPMDLFAEEAKSTVHFSETIDNTNTIGEIGGYLANNVVTVKKIYNNHLFTAPKGHGFAAERANNLYDAYKGNVGNVVGDSFDKNGPDREIINRNGTKTLIQDKYYQTARKSINAAFDENGIYKYVDKYDMPMKLEVPKDQYDEAVAIMRDKIKNGQVKNVTDPDEAKNIVKKGNVTYKQAVNIAKAGNIDSLMYDAANGVVSAGCAVGISFAIDYAVCLMNGLESEAALDTAIKNGLKTGEVVFATFVISSQIARTGAKDALTPTTEAIAKALGKEVCESILASTGIEVTGKTAAKITTKVADILAQEIIVDAVMVVVLTGVDVVNLFNGRISEEELLKNLTVTLVSVAAGAAGGVAGATVGQFVLPGAGAAIGKIAGSTIAGGTAALVSELIAAKIYKSDAEEMFDIISEQFLIMCEDYIISEEEGTVITEELSKILDGDILKDMYASENREEFAQKLMEPLFEEQIKKRPEIEIPTEAEMRWEYKEMLQGVVFIH